MKKTLLAILLAAPLAFAQPKPKPSDVVISQVNDRRGSGPFAQLTISLELPGVRSSDVAATRVLVAAAVDDSGKSLVEGGGKEPELEPTSRMSMGQDDANPQPARVSVTLKNPERKAKKLKEVRGEIELYMPAKDPNSVAEIAKFLSTSGKPLAHKALAANGVEIALVGPAQIAAEKKKRGEAKRAEGKAAGLEGKDLEDYVSSYLESQLKLEDDEVLLRIKDPNKRIQQIGYVTAAGEAKQTSRHDDEGFTKLSTWGDKPQADWKLRVSMTTPKNVSRLPFTLVDVPLP